MSYVTYIVSSLKLKHGNPRVGSSMSRTPSWPQELKICWHASSIRLVQWFSTCSPRASWSQWSVRHSPSSDITLHFITLHYLYFTRHLHLTLPCSGASTKLCTTVSICQCKQMSFQLPFESIRISKFLESKRKIIPSFRPGLGEASLAELALQ